MVGGGAGLAIGGSFFATFTVEVVTLLGTLGGAGGGRGRKGGRRRKQGVRRREGEGVGGRRLRDRYEGATSEEERGGEEEGEGERGRREERRSDRNRKDSEVVKGEGGKEGGRGGGGAN